MKNVMVAQSGGPTVAINASLLGVLKKARSLGVHKVYGACFGLSGLLEGKIVDLSSYFDQTKEARLLQTPASFLGSCRKKIPYFNGTIESELIYSKIAEIFKKLDVGSFFYIGGNDSMDTVAKLSSYFKDIGSTISIIGVPKTIDNDLCEIDHCPGFGSAAKFVATTFLELERDCSVYCLPAVTIVEVMGRDAGWLTASSVLSRLNGANGPNLIYCCEQEFSVSKFLGDVEQQLAVSSNGSVLVAVSEGLQIEKEYLEQGENRVVGWFDEFCHTKKAGVAKVLEGIVFKKIGCKVRSIELSLLQRCSAHLASATDLQESEQVGMKSVELAASGLTGVMATIKRTKNEPYEIEFGYVEVQKVANKVKKMPAYMFNGLTDVSSEAVLYFKPLIQGSLAVQMKNALPVHLCLHKNFVKF